MSVESKWNSRRIGASVARIAARFRTNVSAHHLAVHGLLSLALAAGVLACGGAQTAEPHTETDWTRAADEAELGGRWAARWTTVTETPAPLGAVVRSTQRRVALLDATEGEEGVRFEGEVCALEVESSTSLASTVIPEAYMRALPALSLVATRAAGALRFAPTVEVVGAEVAPGVALPTTAEDPAVIDADEDGQPGVTVRVTGMAGGELYFVQRREIAATLRYEGGRWAGPIAWSFEQSVLGATSARLRQPRETRVADDPSAHVLELVPVQDETPCAEAGGVFR